MGAFIARQPNGKLCRFSTTVDTVTNFNMTDEDYIEMCVKKSEQEAREEAINVLNKHLHPFEDVKNCFFPNNNTIEEFERYLKQMGDEEGLGEARIKGIKDVLEEQ